MQTTGAKRKKVQPPETSAPDRGGVGREVFDVASATILQTLFTTENLRRTIKRMRAWQEGENEVSHPLRLLILLEYEEALAQSLAASIPAGTWRASSSYTVLVSKRSGTYRELVFPCLTDTIVGRRIIDAMEPHITKDDNNRVFFGRSHANVDRARGDYENWFQVWLDFSSSISHALEQDGYTYVFETDITQFFPSVDRERAKHALAQRTQAHQTILELLFYCLSSWTPRVRYCALSGLPIEPNDVSRLVAHNFLKGVGEHFVGDSRVYYLRWVDDTSVFVPDEPTAHEIKRQHHLALREMGLSPNAAKTSIVTAKEYGETRHPLFNRMIDDVNETSDQELLSQLVDQWYSKDRNTPNWDKVASRLYTAARKMRLGVMRQHTLRDVEEFPRLQRAAFTYLLNFELKTAELNRILDLYGKRTTSVELRIDLARFLGDARITCDTTDLVNRVVGEIIDDDGRAGNGYAQGLLLLVVNKHGGRDHRAKLRKHLILERLQDDQLRLHHLYVFFCRGELDEGLARAARHLDTPDIALLMRLCQDAKDGKLLRHESCLKTCFAKHSGSLTILAKYLPFLHVLLRAPAKEVENRRWLETANSPENLSAIKDPVIKRFLQEEKVLATR